jgi:hypothetical protein
MRVLQVATSRDERCGVGNFARTMEAELRGATVEVETVTSLTDTFQVPDITVIHYEKNLIDDAALSAMISNSPRPVVLFAHSPGAERFDNLVDAFVAMSEGSVRDPTKPCLIITHPAWVPAKLTNRDELRSRFGLPADSIIIGTSGFLTPGRQFPRILNVLLPIAAETGWLITLVTSRWRGVFPELEHDLASLAAKYPGHMTYGTGFLPAAELNARLQACDLLWCWTSTPSTPYASGSVTDQYASGTRLVAAKKLQHEHILRLPNTVAAPARLNDFTECLIAEITRGIYPRHEPSPVSWSASADQLSALLAGVARHVIE